MDGITSVIFNKCINEYELLWVFKLHTWIQLGTQQTDGKTGLILFLLSVLIQYLHAIYSFKDFNIIGLQPDLEAACLGRWQLSVR